MPLRGLVSSSLELSGMCSLVVPETSPQQPLPVALERDRHLGFTLTEAAAKFVGIERC